MILTINKMLKIAKIPVVVTEQVNLFLSLFKVKSPENKGLGNTIPDIDLPSLGPLLVATTAKGLFSMMMPEVKAILHEHPQIKSVVLFGIEVSLPYNNRLISNIARFSHKLACCNLFWI